MALNSSSSSADHRPSPAPITTNTAATSTTIRPFTNPSQQPSRPVTPVPRSHPYLAQPRISNPNSAPNVPKPHDAHSPQGILYPVASSGHGFVPKHLRPHPSDQMVTVANPGAFPPRVNFPHQGGRPFGLPNSDSLNHPVHMTRPPYLQHSHPGVVGTSGSTPIKGIPVSAKPKAALSSSSIPDGNGYKDLRDRNRDDSLLTVRDRKVKMADDASLYALCRSWLRNGFHEESQPQYVGNAKPLPRPLPIVPDTQLTKKKEGEGEEENEGSVEHLSAKELLQRHVKHAKKIRARLREKRLQRIARYKTRLATLLPPPVEQ